MIGKARLRIADLLSIIAQKAMVMSLPITLSEHYVSLFKKLEGEGGVQI